MGNAFAMARSHLRLDPDDEALPTPRSLDEAAEQYRLSPVRSQLSGGRVVQLIVQNPLFKSLLGN